MGSRRDFYIAKANFCTMMAQQLVENEAQQNWLALATEWLSLAEAEVELDNLRAAMTSGGAANKAAPRAA